MTLPGEICAVLVTSLVLEGWSNRLAPEHSVLSQVPNADIILHVLMVKQMPIAAPIDLKIPVHTNSASCNDGKLLVWC